MPIYIIIIVNIIIVIITNTITVGVFFGVANIVREVGGPGNRLSRQDPQVVRSRIVLKKYTISSSSIVAFARFASKLKRQRLISSPIAATPNGFGIKNCLGIPSIHTHEWTEDLTIKEWWSLMSCKASPNRKAMASFTMLVSWTIWEECNARVFLNKAVPSTILLGILKEEVRLWVSAGAKHLSFVISGE
jgi:hypothetical protein